MDWGEAIQYCESLSVDGGGWHLPTIGELRTLVRGCPDTEIDGSCDVLDATCLTFFTCWNPDLCSGCPLMSGPGEGGMYWPQGIQGDCCLYWSSSLQEDLDDSAWAIGFSTAGILGGGTKDFGVGTGYFVRCVR